MKDRTKWALLIVALFAGMFGAGLVSRQKPKPLNLNGAAIGAPRQISAPKPSPITKAVSLAAVAVLLAAYFFYKYKGSFRIGDIRVQRAVGWNPIHYRFTAPPRLSVREKASAIHNFVLKAFTYNNQKAQATGYIDRFALPWFLLPVYHAFFDVALYFNTKSCLETRKALAENYAALFNIIARENGLPCYTVFSRTMRHAWNIVQDDNGKWMQVDCAWDSIGGHEPSFWTQSQKDHHSVTRIVRY
jgi:transglutaminase/protease-like cytokinesis protein 3